MVQVVFSLHLYHFLLISLIFLGQTQIPLVDLLAKYEIPKGIFPSNIVKYSFDLFEEGEGGKLKVHLPFKCEVKFSDGHILRYQKEVDCEVEKGKLIQVVGLQSQGIFWSEVTDIIMNPNGKIEFHCGSKKAKVKVNYEHPRVGVEVLKT